MSINKRQFKLLKAMGITVWQRRSLLVQAALSNTNNKETNCETTLPVKVNTVAQRNNTPAEPTNDLIAIELTALLKQPLFKDILLSLGASSADLAINKNQIDLGIINWQFSTSEKIELKHNCLTTPELAIIANSASLKKSLWQTLSPLSSS